MIEEIITLEKRDGLAWLTFNRPEVRNAFNEAMYLRFFALCEEINQDRSVKVLILSGAGGKGFGAGGDIAAMRQQLSQGIEGFLNRPKYSEQVLDTLDTMRVPTIAAVAGPATGGGAALALSCDLRIGSPSARFGFPIARSVGNCLGMRLYARLLASMGRSRVMDMIFTARLIGAAEAHTIGILNYLTPDEESLIPGAEELARKVAEHAPLTLRATRESLRRIESQLVLEGDNDDLVRWCITSRDFKEGVAAFLEKRKPQWVGE